MSLIDSINETNAYASKVSEKYVKTSYKYYKLKIFEQFTISMGMVVKVILIGGLALIGMSFIAVALAFSIGNALGNLSLGFVSVGLLFFILSLIIFFLRVHINNFIIKKLSKKFFS
ncbi:hypothetical protein GSB9_01876 [Flavobacteriaceae bacterium GSB9]|nr:hypothetical protein GSB9_01876 [Flavobacteriaceae bacterium GSB9]